MNQRLIAALLVLLTRGAIAGPDEAVVRELARFTTLQEDQIRRHYASCDSGVTAHMKICGAYSWIKQEMRLKRAYAHALKEAKELGHAAELMLAQRTWLAYRDAQCPFEGMMAAGGGTAEGLHVLSCKEALTQERAQRLEGLLLDE